MERHRDEVHAQLAEAVLAQAQARAEVEGRDAEIKTLMVEIQAVKKEAKQYAERQGLMYTFTPTGAP